MKFIKYCAVILVAACGINFYSGAGAVGPAFTKVPAAEAGDKVGDPPRGHLLRGDSRPPQEIFARGFVPQGDDMNIMHHLSFAGNSGYVSLSRSTEAARRYSFGRTEAELSTGYVYMVSTRSYYKIPDGYYIPDMFGGDPAVRANKEFATTFVPPESIIGAYEYIKQYNYGSGYTLIRARFIPNSGYRGPSSWSDISRYCRNIQNSFCNMYCGGPDNDHAGGSRGSCITNM